MIESHTCPCCGIVISVAERLIDTANTLRYPRDRLLIPVDKVGNTELAQAALSFRLAANPLIAFRAIAENWDHRRIVKELY
jgi:hypothetical protein